MAIKRKRVGRPTQLHISGSPAARQCARERRRELTEPKWSINLRFGAHFGLKSDITALPTRAKQTLGGCRGEPGLPTLATVQVAANATHFHRPMSRDPLAVRAANVTSGMQPEYLVSH